MILVYFFNIPRLQLIIDFPLEFVCFSKAMFIYRIHAVEEAPIVHATPLVTGLSENMVLWCCCYARRCRYCVGVASSRQFAYQFNVFLSDVFLHPLVLQRFQSDGIQTESAVLSAVHARCMCGVCVHRCRFACWILLVLFLLSNVIFSILIFAFLSRRVNACRFSFGEFNSDGCNCFRSAPRCEINAIKSLRKWWLDPEEEIPSHPNTFVQSSNHLFRFHSN